MRLLTIDGTRKVFYRIIDLGGSPFYNDTDKYGVARIVYETMWHMYRKQR